MRDMGYGSRIRWKDEEVRNLELREEKEEAGLGKSLNPQSPIPDPAATAAVRHERPKRFVYGQKQNS